MANKTKRFVVTGGTVFQKVDGRMKPHTAGDKITLAVGEDGLPVSKGIRSRVEARKAVPLKEGEENSEQTGK